MNHPNNSNNISSDSIKKTQELTVVYTQAISEFIRAAYKKDKITFDTLYFGKHVYGQPDDFPDIELPNIIEKTQIKLVSPDIGQLKQKERQSLIYVNLMGWIDRKRAEFLFVVFSNGGKHQYDYSINFLYNALINKFELYRIEFENYTQLDRQKQRRITIYQDGKYIENK